MNRDRTLAELEQIVSDLERIVGELEQEKAAAFQLVDDTLEALGGSPVMGA